MKRLVIIESDKFLSKKRIEFFERKGSFASKAYSSIDDFLENVNWNFDIAIVEVTLKGKISAFELGGLLKQKNKPFIFLSEQQDEEPTSKVVNSQPCAFFYKPVKNEDLLIALALIRIKRQPKIEVRGSHGVKSVNPSDIQFIQTQRNYLDIVAVNGTYTRRGTLKEIIEELPDTFVRVNRFFVVNTNFIEQKSSSQLVIDSRLIPISRNFKDQLGKYA